MQSHSQNAINNGSSVNVEDANSQPEILAQEFTVQENSAKETVVGTISANDADDDDLTFRILSISPETEEESWLAPFKNSNGSFEQLLNSSGDTIGMNFNDMTGNNGLFYSPNSTNPLQAYYNKRLVLSWSTDDIIDVIEMYQNDYSADGTTFSAYDGEQWAELNAESVSALYFDLPTIPGATMTWRFAHRARRNAGEGEDCMRLRIGNSDEGSINDLPAIDEFCSAQVNNADNMPENGSSTSNGWVLYEGTYTVPEGQYFTRFAYQAISSSRGNTVEGNFIDGVDFYIDYEATDVFDLDTSTGELKVNNPFKLDYEATPTFTIEVEVSDGVLTDTAMITVNLLDGADFVVWNGASWSREGGPQAIDHALFLEDYSFEDDGITQLEVSNIAVQSGAQLVVEADQLLKVTGYVFNNGEITIESGGTLLTYESNSVSGNDITIKRNTRYADGKYSFVGSPVEASEIRGSDLGTIVYQYNEQTPYGSNDGLSRWENASDALLASGRGYAQANQQEIIFTGTPNTGTVSYSGTYTEDTDDANEGWNLVANPYAASISVAEFLNGNDNIDALYTAVYLWDDNGSDQERGSNSDYIVANLSGVTQTTPAGGDTRYNGYLGSAQGFFVKLEGAEDTAIEFTESMRAEGDNGDDHFFRMASQSGYGDIRINLTNDIGLFKQALVVVKEDIQDQIFNKGYDAKVLNPQQSDAVFSYKLGEPLAIQTVSDQLESISLGMNVEKVGTYHISVESTMNGFVYLRDKLTNQVMDLLADGYTFQTSENQLTDRFELLLVGNVLHEQSNINLRMYPNPVDELLYLNYTPDDISAISLYSIDGAMFKRLKYSNTKVDVSGVPSGTYILLVETESGQTFSEKLVVRH